MNTKIKMKLLGLFLVSCGSVLLIYSIFFGSSGMGFWIIYIALLMLITGLGMLGLNVGYPF